MGIRVLNCVNNFPSWRIFLTSSVVAVAVLTKSISFGLAEEACTEVPSRPADPVPGTLFICGGGFLSDDLLNEFIKRIGGDDGHLVLITTANWRADTAGPDEIMDIWRPYMKGKITLVHTTSRETADSEEFVAPIRAATGVWLMSGKQNRLTDAYLGTALLRELHAFVNRGGVIGGTSAGAAAISDVMICGGTLDCPNIYQGLALLRDGIIDQHFSQRKREPRLLFAMNKHPGRVGFGIDEGTALVVHGRDLRVSGDGNVTVYLAPSANRPLQVTKLKAGDRHDLQALRRAALARAADPFQPSSPTGPLVPQGSLVIAGGGVVPADVQKKFIDLAGGPTATIAVVPSADDSAKSDVDELRWLAQAGAKNIVVVNPNSREEADDPKLVAALKEASGVWIGGGRQWRLVDYFEKTACYEAFCDVLKRGGVIGGNSAGASIQGEYLVRGNPLDNAEMIAEGYERGFGFLPGAAIDQHFTQRKRQQDMEQLKRTFPKLLGLGIDEGTAVVVHGGQLEVIGKNTVSVYPPMPTDGEPAKRDAEANVENIAASGPNLVAPQVLKPGDAYDLEHFNLQGSGGR